jgi:hypothetical protein
MKREDLQIRRRKFIRIITMNKGWRYKETKKREKFKDKQIRNVERTTMKPNTIEPFRKKEEKKSIQEIGKEKEKKERLRARRNP